MRHTHGALQHRLLEEGEGKSKDAEELGSAGRETPGDCEAPGPDGESFPRCPVLRIAEAKGN